MNTTYFLYILKCSDSSLYTGITNNLSNRLAKHNEGKGSKYVNSRKPFRLIYQEEFPSKSQALKREMEIKGWSREEKIRKLKLNFSGSPHSR